jgi:exonuclease I
MIEKGIDDYIKSLIDIINRNENFTYDVEVEQNLYNGIIDNVVITIDRREE